MSKKSENRGFAESDAMAENGVIEILRGIQAEMSGLKAEIRADISGLKVDISGLRADMTGLKHDMSGIKADISGLKTDMHSHSDTLNVLLQDVREIRAAVNDIERTRVSIGETEAASLRCHSNAAELIGFDRKGGGIRRRETRLISALRGLVR